MFRWFKKKQPLQTHADRINDAQKVVDDALDFLEKAKQRLVEANENLDTVIAEAQEDVARATATIDSANAKKQRNSAVHAKFSDLTSAD